MSRSWTFSKGLHDIGDGAFAYLQPDGGWGWSNAGLLVDGEASLLVDTLFDMKLTDEMLRTMQSAAGVSGEDVGVVVNTHANGDHTHGNGCCPGADIVASAASAAEMEVVNAAMMAQMMVAAPGMGEVGEFITEIFSPFDFAGVTERLPTRTFSGELTLEVGDRAVELIEVGPAHTAGDVLVHVPDARIVFTGDILFINCTPVMWAGPVANWIAACDRIIDLGPEVIVPGHGPIAEVDDVRRVQAYLRFVTDEARQRFDAGLSVRDAVFDIALGEFRSWGDAERLAVNVTTLYREFEGRLDEPASPMDAFGLMAELHKKL